MYVDAEQSGWILGCYCRVESKQEMAIDAEQNGKKTGQQAFNAEWRAGRFLYVDAEQNGKKGWTVC